MADRPPLARELAALAKRHGEPKPPPARGALELVLWENVAYLVDDRRRAEAFRALRERVGTSAAAILGARREVLLEVALLGGMHPEARVGKLLAIAERVQDELDGDLEAVLRRPPKEALKILKRFPGIGDPGAEKILLFTGVLPVLALESNGLRVLLRLGYGREEKSYAATYRSVRRAVEGTLPADCAKLRRAHMLLRAHGQALCKRSSPLCEECPLTGSCPWFRDIEA